MNTRDHERRVVRVPTSITTAAFLAAAAITGCAASNGGNGGGPPGDTGTGNDGPANTNDGAANPDGGNNGMDVTMTGVDSGNDVNYYAQRHDGQIDPPPMYCYADGGRGVGDVGPDPYCPPGRNLSNCPCPTAGMTAPCWNGPTAAEGHGSCMDGTTTCSNDEIPVWGACVGEVDPVPDAGGMASCNCFSSGTWNVTNSAPCVGTLGATSSMQAATMGGQPTCGTFYSGSCTTSSTCGAQGTCVAGQCAPAAPSTTWSTDTLTVDCGGQFQLCYRLRAFASMTNAASMTTTAADCVMADPCVNFYVQPTADLSQPQTLPPLPGWATTTAAQVACAAQFDANGGYAEMVVSGLSYECQDLSEGMPNGYVFNDIMYCSSACAMPNPPSALNCAQCSNGSSGMF